VCQDDVASKSLDDYIMRHYLPVAGRQPGKHDLVHAVQSVVRNLTTAASQHNCRTRCNTSIATLEGATREEYRQGHSTWKDDLSLSLAWQMCSLYHLTNGERRIAQTRFSSIAVTIQSTVILVVEVRWRQKEREHVSRI
jgi:hypothetical protein